MLGRKFYLNGKNDSSLFSIAAFQLCCDADVDETSPLCFSRQRLAQYFLTQFRGTWDPASQHLWARLDHLSACSARVDKSKWDDLVFQYHMRVFTCSAEAIPTRRYSRGLQRAAGTLPSKANRASKKRNKREPVSSVYEIRYSVGLKTTWRFDLPVFTLVTMADTATARPPEDPEPMELGNRSQWEAADLDPSIRATGMAAFAFKILSLLPQWQAEWSKLLNEIGTSLNNDVSQGIFLWRVLT